MQEMHLQVNLVELILQPSLSYFLQTVANNMLQNIILNMFPFGVHLK